MAADLHIHVVTDKFDNDTLKCFFSSSLGSKWFSLDYKCDYEKRRDDIYNKKLELLYEKYPKAEYTPIFKLGKKAREFWMSLINEYYKEAGYNCIHYSIVMESPNVWVGEVSWLKAALFEDADSFVPSSVGEIAEIIGDDLPVINDDLISKIKIACQLPNNTIKEGGVYKGAGYSLANVDDIINFLEEHKGEKCFTVSW